jgi:hypothetical protein
VVYTHLLHQLFRVAELSPAEGGGGGFYEHRELVGIKFRVVREQGSFSNRVEKSLQSLSPRQPVPLPDADEVASYLVTPKVTLRALPVFNED